MNSRLFLALSDNYCSMTGPPAFSGSQGASHDLSDIASALVNPRQVPMPPFWSFEKHMERVKTELSLRNNQLDRFQYLNALKWEMPGVFYQLLINNMTVSPQAPREQTVEARYSPGNNAYPLYAYSTLRCAAFVN